MTTDTDFTEAELILHEYGKLLSSVEPSIYGMPLSLLPYDKEQIKSAIQTLLLNLPEDSAQIRDGLVQGYVYLAQFIPDELADQALKGCKAMEIQEKSAADLELANTAIRILSEIKADMENLMNEIRMLLK